MKNFDMVDRKLAFLDKSLTHRAYMYFGLHPELCQDEIGNLAFMIVRKKEALYFLESLSEGELALIKEDPNRSAFVFDLVFALETEEYQEEIETYCHEAIVVLNRIRILSKDKQQLLLFKNWLTQ